MVNSDTSPQETGHHRSACTECSRRKQKCNREWPCNHCQKRKVADKCRFNTLKPQTKPQHDHSSPQEAVRKRAHKEEESEESDSSEEESSSNDSDDGGFEALGYSAAHHFSSLTVDIKKKRGPPKQYYMQVASCPQLERALHALPPRPYTDSLVQNFLNNVNFHYYIVYPQSFLENYQQWWEDRTENRPLGLQWTCLLLMVCACSAQYTDVELERKLSADLGQPVQKLTERYHNAGRELHSVIPVGHSHLLNVQQLLHSCYWFKSESRYIECWHVLNAAIREAQELGMHQESAIGPVPEFELEMRRRVWCILNTWDWQISALLGRPMIIDRSDCDVGLPSLNLEDYSPSPMLHMRLQSELIGQLAEKFVLPKYITKPDTIQEYQRTIHRWMAQFPPTYDFDNPDKRMDEKRPWVVLHRHYIHTMSYSMLLDPIRAYLAKPMSTSFPSEELKIRSDGVDYALNLIKALYGFFNHVYPRDAKFHFVLFAIFDTSAVLCSALIHDQDQTIPRRQDIYAAIRSATQMLHRLSSSLKAAKTSHQILLRLSQKAMQPYQVENHSRKRHKTTDASLTPPSQGQSPSDFGIPEVIAGPLPPSSSTSSPSNIPYTQSTPPQSNIPEAITSAGFSAYPNSSATSSLPPADVQTPPKDGNEALKYRQPLVGNMPPLGQELLHFPQQPTPYSQAMPAESSMLQAAYMPMQTQPQPHHGELGWSGLSDQDLAGLADLWDWQSLDLNFMPPQGQ